MKTAIPLILDTDIGDDIDDALALALALRCPEIDLIGITTVFRNAPRRALLAEEICSLMAREIPIAAGCSRPLLQSYEGIPAGDKLGRQFEMLDAERKFPRGPHALDFLAEQLARVEKEGKRLTIAPIGPLTNIALFFARYPEAVSRCSIMLMGGCWSHAKPEWNIRCDPEAAAMVFRSGAEISMVGLDVTLRCKLSQEETDRFRQSNRKHAAFLGRLIDLWNHAVTLHDPLTLLALFSPLVAFEPKHIEVGLCGELRGHTQVLEKTPNCRVAVDVDAPAAIRLFLDRVLS